MKLLAGFISLCLTIVAVVYIVHTPKTIPEKSAGERGVLTVSAAKSKNFSPTNIRYELRFEKRGPKKSALIEASGRAGGELLEFVKTLGISSDSVTAKRFSLEKSWKWENNKRLPDGFEISQSFSVNLPDPSKVPVFIEGVAAIQDLEIVRSTAELAQETEKRNEVYREAVNEATEKAKILAEAAGKKLGKILLIADENSQATVFESAVYYDNAVALGGSRKMAKTQMPEQKIEIGAGVSMKFELK